MALEQITNKILDDAKSQAQAILKEAEDKASAILSEANKECEKLQNDFALRLKDEEADIYKKAAIIGKLDVAKIELQGKRDLIGATNALALQKLRSLPEGEYLAFVARLLDQISADGVVRVGKGEKFLTKDWLATYCEGKGRQITFSSEIGNFVGGFVFYAEDKAYDLSFAMLLKNYNEKCEATVVKHLFDSLQSAK